MNFIKGYILEKHPNMYREYPSIEESCKMFDLACSYLEESFNSSRKRRMDQMKILTLARLIKVSMKC
jgi:hypothetical protein